jgi:CRP/FNR family transcriptional regulator
LIRINRRQQGRSMIGLVNLAAQNIVNPSARSHVACAACALRKFCFASVGAEGAVAAQVPLVHRRRLRAGEKLFTKGSPLQSLYAVRAGFLKTCAVLPNGDHRILGFHIMGDVIGLDALATGMHPTEAVALNGCEVCEIPTDRAERLMAGRNSVAVHFRQLLSEQIAGAGERIVALGALSARQRVAQFLLDLSERWAARGYSPNEFDLCLTRKEIGSYLGLTFETVSRTLSFFDAQEWVAVDGRHVRIRDHGALRATLVEN